MLAGHSSSLLLSALLLRFLLANFQPSSAAPNWSAVKIPPYGVTRKDFLQYVKVDNTNVTFDLPALYVFGDSQLDSGHYLYPPYGVDFEGPKPSGRNTNGRTMADFIAQAAGLPFPPPYISASDSAKKNTRTGFNYAYSGCGILPSTGNTPPLNFGCASLDRQVDMFESTVGNLTTQFNNKDNLSKYLSKSVFLLYIGTNDMGINYKINKALQQQYDPLAFSKFLADELAKRIERIYKLGGRKFVVGNLFVSMPCVTSDDSCMPYKMQNAYNDRVFEVLKNLESANSGLKFVHLDARKVEQDIREAPASFGIVYLAEACCSVDKQSPRPECIEGKPICSDRNQYVYFDKVHKTQIMHFLWAKRCMEDSSICTPTTLLKFLQD